MTHASTSAHDHDHHDEHDEPKGKVIKTGEGAPCLIYFILVIVILVTALIMFIGKKKHKVTEGGVLEEVYVPPPDPVYKDEEIWFINYANGRIVKHLSMEYQPWSIRPLNPVGMDSIPVLVITEVDEPGKPLLIDKGGQATPCNAWRPDPEKCYLIRQALPGEYDPLKRENPARGFSLGCYTCEDYRCDPINR